ncbi:M48 family metallopeptidase [Ferruginibacter sp. SUN002]|uniref:M48 family metallopeptidase n=1 Tax=Ferruginibacter sp. SUN002 TaxID=2937789 RepID=UPI003D369B63
MYCPQTNAYTKFFVAIFFSILSIQSFAQGNSFSFGELSATKYKEKIAQLEKFKVSKKYDDKSAQAWYKEILSDRNKSLQYAFKENKVVYDSFLLTKCNDIFRRIMAANRNYNFDSITLYINRSVIANAVCYGEGTIMINLGLFFWVDNDDELAMVIAHELAHQLLKHSDRKIEKSIAMLTSEDFKEELKDIKKSNEGKYSRFRELMKDLNIESGKHSTYKESEADSLGAVLIKNAGYDVNKGAKILLKLDNTDDIFKSKKLYTLKEYLENTGIDLSHFNVKPKYNGLSSMNVEMNADKDFDSIKTHPDCIKRYKTITGNTDTASIVCCTELNSSYAAYKENAMLETVRYLYENNSLGWCIHLSLIAIKNNYDPVVYNRFLSLCFSKLYDDDKRLARFSGANADAERESNLKETQDYLFAANTADLEKLALHFLKYKVDTNSEDYLFADLMYNTQIKMKDANSAYESFLNKFPKSKYQYLIQKK